MSSRARGPGVPLQAITTGGNKKAPTSQKVGAVKNLNLPIDYDVGYGDQKASSHTSLNWLKARLGTFGSEPIG